MSHSMQNPNHSNALSPSNRSEGMKASPVGLGLLSPGSEITTLNIEFVAKPAEAQKVQTSLPVAVHGALREVAGFAGSLVMIANHETRLVTVVTFWKGEDRSQRCGENARWVRALVTPYMDRCLRVQTMTAYMPATPQASQEFKHPWAGMAPVAEWREEESVCLA